jgi:hypothetical protein
MKNRNDRKLHCLQGNENLIGRLFKTHKAVFYSEDVEKMETMTLEEKNEYLRYLKGENRYVYEDE